MKSVEHIPTDPQPERWEVLPSAQSYVWGRSVVVSGVTWDMVAAIPAYVGGSDRAEQRARLIAAAPELLAAARASVVLLQDLGEAFSHLPPETPCETCPHCDIEALVARLQAVLDRVEADA